jgi:hypothetical protein
MGLGGPDWGNRIRLCQWKISGKREGFMHTRFSMHALANKVSRTKSMRFQGRSPTGPWPQLNFAPSRAYTIMPLICLPCMHAYGAHIASKQLSLWFACHACMQSCIANKQKERKKRERKSSMNCMHLWFHGWQGSQWVVSLFPIFYFALTVTSHHSGQRIVS